MTPRGMVQLSVIVPTRNRARLLAGTLESITRQTITRERFEVLVIDNGSTDSTSAVCERYADRLPGFRRIRDERPGLHVGRHLGLHHAAGEVLVFADDDIEALPTWLEAVARCFQDPDTVLVGGNNLPLLEESVPVWWDRLWTPCEFGRYLGPLSLIEFGSVARPVPASFVYGCNFSIRKSVLRELGGFHPDGMPKELLCFRGDGETHISEALTERGISARFEPEASVRHRVPAGRLNAGYFRDRAFAQGISASYTRLRRRGAASPGEALAALPAAARGLAAAVRQTLRRDGRPFALSQWLGYWQGRLYHFRGCRRDPAVLSWVLQRGYMDDDSMSVPAMRKSVRGSGT